MCDGPAGVEPDPPYPTRAGVSIGGATIGFIEVAVQIHIERLPEGVFLATSEQLPGLVAQGWTVAETLEIARNVALNLLEARWEREGGILSVYA